MSGEIEMDERFLQVFREEFDRMTERLEAVGVALLDAATPRDLDEAFRALHTLKGNCYAMGYQGMGRLAHAFEDVLGGIRTSGETPGSALGELLLEVNDELRRMIDAPESPAPDALLDRIEALASGSAGAEPEAIAEPPNAAETANTASAAEPARSATGAQSPGEAAPTQAGRSRALQIPVDISALDALFEATETLRAELRQTGDAAAVRRAEEIGRRLLTMRRMPIAKIAPPLHRVVRDTARKLDREIEFTLAGDDLQADASLVQDLAAVLPHMLRNSIDHGIEPPGERAEEGKEPAGRLELRFLQEPGAFVVAIEDDGRGMDADAIVRSAVAKGLVTEEEAARLGREDRLRLVFRSGFSTAERVSEVSGRGVGMDVVADAVERHQGRIGIRSEPGHGTRFELRFPVLFRWEDYLIAEIDHRRIGLPVRAVVEVASDGAAWVPDGHAVQVGDNTYTLIGFADLDPAIGAVERRPLVILDLGGRPAAMSVDALGGFTGTLVQALPGRDAPSYLAGIGETPDGRVLWGIDIEQIIDHWTEYRVGG